MANRVRGDAAKAQRRAVGLSALDVQLKPLLNPSPPYLFATPIPSTCVRTQTSCPRDPNSILVFFHFSFLSDLSHGTCPSVVPPEVLDLIVISCDVPAEWDHVSLPAFGLLGQVFHFHLSKVQADVFRQTVIAAGASSRHGSNQDFLQLNRDVLYGLLAAGFAHREHRGIEVRPVTTRQHDLGRTAVEVLGDAQVLHAHFAAAGSAAHMGRAAVRHPPRPGEDVDFLSMRLIF